MEFNLDDEQQALKDMARALLAQSYSDPENRRRVVSHDLGYDPSVLVRLGAQGLLGLPIAETYGGSDATLVEAAIVAREIGRVLSPEPFVATVLSSLMVSELGTDLQRKELLPALCGGESIVVLAHAEPGSRWGATVGAVRAARAGETWTLSGVKEPVEFGAQADAYLVTATLPDGGVGVFQVEAGAKGSRHDGYRTTGGGRAARLTLEQTPGTPLGETVEDRSPQVARTLSTARVLAAHEALGAMEAALSMTCTYLTQRQQFGRTLNQFQALTFRAADMYVELELADSMASWAAMVTAEAGQGGEDAADRASAQVARAARHIAQEAIQLHGGIGMTAEHPIGMYAQRLTALVQTHGTSEWHVGALARRVDQHDVLDPLESTVV